MKCEHIRKLLTSYLLGDLAGATNEEIKSHIENCTGCRAAAQEVEPTLDLLRDALAAPSLEEAPKHLSADRRAHIMAAFDAPAAKPAKPEPWVYRHHKALAAAAALLLVCGVFSVLLQDLFKMGEVVTEVATPKHWFAQSELGEDALPASGPRVRKAVESFKDAHAQRLAQSIAKQKEAVKKLRAAREGAYERFSVALKQRTKQADPALAALPRVDRTDLDVDLNGKDVGELYEIAKDLDKESYDLYRQTRALELARIQHVPLKDAMKVTQIAQPERKELDKSKLTQRIVSTTDGRLGELKNELATARSEVAAMTSASERMADVAATLSEPELLGTGSSWEFAAGEGAVAGGRKDTRREQLAKTFQGYSPPSATAFEHEWGVGAGPITEKEETPPAFVIPRTGEIRGGRRMSDTDRKSLANIRAKAIRKIGGKLTEPTDPNDPVQVAEAHFLNGDYQSAWKAYNRAGDKAKPDVKKLDSGFTKWLIDSNTQAGNFDNAESLARAKIQWMDTTPDALTPKERMDTMLSYANIAKSKQEYPRAKAIYQQIANAQEFASMGRGKVDAELRIAEIERATGQREEAEARLNKLLKRRNRYIQTEANLELAKTHLDGEDYTAAQEALGEVLARSPNHPEARILEGQLKLATKRLEQASQLSIGLAAGQQELVPGKPLRVTVEDQTLSVVGRTTEIKVRAHTESGDEETFTLRPFADSRTRFASEILTKVGTAEKGDGVLQVKPGEKVYYDYAPGFKREHNIKTTSGDALTVAYADEKKESRRWSIDREIEKIEERNKIEALAGAGTDAELYASAGKITTREEAEERAIQRAIKARLGLREPAKPPVDEIVEELLEEKPGKLTVYSKRMPRENSGKKARIPRDAEEAAIYYVKGEEALLRKAYEQHAEQTLAQAQKALKGGKSRDAMRLFKEATEGFKRVGDRPEKRELLEQAKKGLVESTYQRAVDLTKHGDVKAAEQLARRASVEGHPKAPILLADIEPLKKAPPLIPARGRSDVSRKDALVDGYWTPGKKTADTDGDGLEDGVVVNGTFDVTLSALAEANAPAQPEFKNYGSTYAVPTDRAVEEKPAPADSGGLYHVVEKKPLLSKVPLIGRLFTRKKEPTPTEPAMPPPAPPPMGDDLRLGEISPPPAKGFGDQDAPSIGELGPADINLYGTGDYRGPKKPNVRALRRVMKKYPKSPEAARAHAELERMGVKIGGGLDDDEGREVPDIAGYDASVDEMQEIIRVKERDALRSTIVDDAVRDVLPVPGSAAARERQTLRGIHGKRTVTARLPVGGEIDQRPRAAQDVIPDKTLRAKREVVEAEAYLELAKRYDDLGLKKKSQEQAQMAANKLAFTLRDGADVPASVREKAEKLRSEIIAETPEPVEEVVRTQNIEREVEDATRVTYAVDANAAHGRLGQGDAVAGAKRVPTEKEKQEAVTEAYRMYKNLTWDYPASKWAKYSRGRIAEESFKRADAEGPGVAKKPAPGKPRQKIIPPAHRPPTTRRKPKTQFSISEEDLKMAREAKEKGADGSVMPFSKRFSVSGLDHVKPEAQFRIAQLNEKIGKKEQALAEYRRVIEKYPDSEYTAQALEKVVDHDIKTGDLVSAQDKLERALKDYPDGKAAEGMLQKSAEVAYRMGNLEKARDRYQQAIFEYPGSKLAKRARENLKRIDQRLGRGERTTSGLRAPPERAARVAEPIRDPEETKMLETINRLKNIKIPEVDFRQANIQDVVEFLQDASVEYDPEVDPEKRKGANMVLHLGHSAAPPPEGPVEKEKVKDEFGEDAVPPGIDVPNITFTARDISAMEALSIVTQVANLKYRIRDGRVIIVPKAAPDDDIIVRMYDVSPEVEQKLAAVAGPAAGPTRKMTANDVSDFFEYMGVQRPTGSSIKYDEKGGKLVSENTEVNAKVLEDILSAVAGKPVKSESEHMKSPAQKAADKRKQAVARKLVDKMKAIKIPEVDFRQANIHDVLEFLQDASVEYDPEPDPQKRTGVNLIPMLGLGKGRAKEKELEEIPRVTFTARYISLWEALGIVTQVANMKSRPAENYVAIVPKDAPDSKIVRREYRVPQGVMDKIAASGAVFVGRTDGELSPYQKKLQGFFESMGVAAPRGSSIKYVPAIGKMVVANTPHNLATFEKILAVFEEDARKKAEEKAEAEAKEKSRFKAFGVNPFYSAAARPFSTFAIDVDTAAYTLGRNYMLKGFLPPAESVRTEEFVNFFDYGYMPPKHGTFAIHTQCAPSKFGRGLHMLKVGVKGRRLGREEQKPAVLTFLIDTSGSMNKSDRLGLVKKSLRMLVNELGPKDMIAIVQYDADSRLVVEHTPTAKKAKILEAIDSMQCGGATNLEKGMGAAYRIAAGAFVPGAENRVLLLSDGVANVGTGAAQDILRSVEKYRKQGIFCSVFGFGIGTYDDEMLESLANKGNGTYTFIDSEAEARRVFVDDLAATLNTIASDVKIQIQFNSKYVKQYRQLGYENRQLKKKDFRNDAVDAGEVGSGQSVTALYELDLRTTEAEAMRKTGDWVAMVRVRYRRTDTGKVEEIEQPVRAPDICASFDKSDVRFKLASCVAEFAEILRGSPFTEGSSYEDVSRVLQPVKLELSLDSHVQELARMVQGAGSMSRGE